jgi:hypothetical protein
MLSFALTPLSSHHPGPRLFKFCVFVPIAHLSRTSQIVRLKQAGRIEAHVDGRFRVGVMDLCSSPVIVEEESLMTTSHLSSIISRDYLTERSYRVVSGLSCYMLILGASMPVGVAL